MSVASFEFVVVVYCSNRDFENSNKTERIRMPPEIDAQWQAHTNCLHPVSQTISREAVCRMHRNEVSIYG